MNSIAVVIAGFMLPRLKVILIESKGVLTSGENSRLSYLTQKEFKLRPSSYTPDEIKEHFKNDPGRPYCLECGSFFDDNTDTSSTHIIAFNYAEYVSKFPEYAMKRLKG